jgi:hypothetical protein
MLRVFIIFRYVDEKTSYYTPMKRSCLNMHDIFTENEYSKHEKFHVATIIELYTHAL